MTAVGQERLNSGEGLPPIRLAAIADANTALAEDGARRYGYEKAVSSWEAVAEDPDIDAVSIVVGNALHRPIAEALVAAGKHVLCEAAAAILPPLPPVYGDLSTVASDRPCVNSPDYGDEHATCSEYRLPGHLS